MKTNHSRAAFLAAWCCAVLVLAAPIPAAGQDSGVVPRPVGIDDLMRLRSVGDVDVSRDGLLVVYTVRGASFRGLPPGGTATSETPAANDAHLWMVRLDGTGGVTPPRRLVAGDDAVASPAISPDGRHVAFVRSGDAGGGWDGLPTHDRDAGARPAQVWVMPIDGGEPVQVSWFTHGAGAPRWSPDGRRLLVGAAVPVRAIEGRRPWPGGRPGGEVPVADRADAADADASPAVPPTTTEGLRRWIDRRAEAADPRVFTRLDFQGERSLAGDLMRSRAAVLTPAAWVLGDASAAPTGEQPAASVRWATEGFDEALEPHWLAGGTRVVFATAPDARIEPDRVDRRVLASTDLEGGDRRILVDLAEWTIQSPRPADDGRIAFLARRIDQPSDRQWRIGMVDPADVASTVREESAVRWLTDEDGFDHSARDPRWHAGRILFTAPVRGGFPLLSVSPGLLEPAAVVDRRDGFPVGVHAFGGGGGTIAWAETHPANPGVLRVRAGDREILAHDLNPWVADRILSMPRRGLVARPRGLEVEYWVMEPVGRGARERSPLVLQIHGGPSAMWGPGEATMWHEFQVLCGWGYGVVYANPRGSGGYGHAFQRANFQDWSQGPAGDVLAALDEAAALDWVDRDALMLTGGSYGGYLVAWILGNDQRFAAAVAQRGVYHLSTFYGEGNAWRLLEWEMGGKPWEARMEAILRRESPFTYVASMRTPLLIMHADRDLRTGVSQSEMLYRALRDLDRPVEYVRYPEEGHELSRSGDPLRRMDRLARIVEFFERFRGGSRPAGRPSP